MAELIEQFWEPDESPDSDCHNIGAVFRAPVNYVDPKLQVLRLTYIDPFHSKPPMLQLGRANESTFDHQPVKELRLKNNEALIAYKAKKRPVLLFSLAPGVRPHIAGGTQDEGFLSLPMFRLRKHADEFTLSVKAFKYESLFYLPEDGRSGLEECMVRFDRAQVIHSAHLERWRPTTKIAPDALLVMQEWFRYYLTGACEDWLLQHQRAELDKLAEALRPPDA